MNSETKQCQNCKNQFVIEPEDFDFYEKVKVPAPTFCSDCRQIRRMIWRNERGLYTRTCNVLGHDEKIISIFSPDSQFKVYDQNFWWSDDWDPFSYGKEYDFSKPFFVQFGELMRDIPHLALSNPHAVNTEYAQHTFRTKNGYLVSAIAQSENVSYANKGFRIKDSMDVYFGGDLDSCYEAVNSRASYKLFFSYGCEDCRDVWFSYDCRGCSDCFGCVNLRNKSYYIFNQPYTKEEYQKKIKEFDLGSYKAVEDIKQQREKLLMGFPRKYIYSLKSVNSTGDNIIHSKNCTKCFDVNNLEDSKFVSWGLLGGKDSYDNYGMGAGNELTYENVFTGEQAAHIYCSSVILSSHHVSYSYNCHGCSNLFGCVGLRNKQYCIFNKQYTKEEYEALVPKIIAHMNDMPYADTKGRVYTYGEFFPFELSPFYYNETIAQEYFPLTKEKATDQGYGWREPEERNYNIDVSSGSLEDHIKDADGSIIGKVVECAHRGVCNEQCTKAFKIIKEELQFYKKMNLPLPRICPNCRHYQRLKQRNPLTLWHRTCQCGGIHSENSVYQNTANHAHGANHCGNEFETTYAPDRPEIVYCEQCYQAEVV